MRKITTMIMVLGVSILLTGCMMQSEAAQEEKKEFESEAVHVTTDVIISDDVYESIYTNGVVQAGEEYQVNAMTNGDVLEIFYQVGDLVEEGDILFTIETGDFEVDKSTNLNQSLNAVSQAKLSYDSAKENFENYTSLYDSGVASKSEYDNMANQYENARISYNNALNSYESVKHNYDTLSDHYEVKAPVSGVVINKSVFADMYVTTQNGFTISLIDQYKVSTQVVSKHINDLTIGQDVDVYVSSLDLTVKGTIESITYSGVNGLYPVEVAIESGHTEIKSGMYTDLWIITGQSKEGLWIPSKALMQENGLSFVYVVEDNYAKKIDVQVLSSKGNQLAVVGDLQVNDSVIILGKEFVSQDTPVIESSGSLK